MTPHRGNIHRACGTLSQALELIIRRWRYFNDMDTDLLKAALPVIGGTLALLGGVFTFVSGRLRDAPDETAKSEVMTLTWLWVASASWFIGIALATFVKLPLVSVPFYCATLTIHVKLFASGPESVSRRAIA